MENFYFNPLKAAAVVISVLSFHATSLKSQSTTSQTYSYTGGMQTFTVPQCVGTITVDVRGAQGANSFDKLPTNSSGGLGGRSTGVMAVTAGQVLNIFVGGVGNINGNGGYNGGGAGGVSTAGSGACTGGPAGGGGGASDIRIGGTALANRVFVAGGGGGSGRDYCNGTCLPCGCGGNGGGGGGLTGALGQAANTCNGGSYNGTLVNFGAGATGAGGGAGGPQDGGTGTNAGTAGVLGVGGTGSIGQYDVAGGGGGGGFYGGGGGGGASNGSGVGGGGGGGGSAFFSGLSNTISTIGFQTGDGTVIITYNYLGALSSVLATPTVICAGQSSTLSAAGQITYTWSPGGSNSNSIVVSPPVTTNYTLQGTNSLGCISSAVISVPVFTAIPSMSLASTASVLCQGKTVIFTATGATSYTWTNGITNGAPYTPTNTGTFIVTGENACGTSSLATSVTVNPSPSITASINNPTVCSGNSIILNGGGSVGGYTWSAGAPNNSAFIPANTTNYTVTGISANGCTNTAVASVTVLITPTVTPVVTPTAMCIGSTATLSAIGATGYTWTPGPLPNTPTVAVSPPLPTTYTLVRTNGVCSSTSTVTLIIYPLPLVAASATPSQICVGTGVNLVVVGPITNTWQPAGFTASNFTVYPNFSTNYTVTGSNGNCTATAVVPVIVNPTPTLSLLTTTNTICAGTNVTLTAGGAQTYTWLPSGNINNTTETVSPPTTTLITLSGTNSFSCTSSQQQLIVVNPLPNMTINSSLPFVCANQTAVLSIANASAMVVYNWNTGPLGTSISVNPAVTTTYFAIGTNTQTGCQNTNSITLAVYISTFAVTNPTAICKGDIATLSAAGQATSYTWTANGSTIAPTVTVSPLVNTTYYVTGTNGSCQSTQTVPIVVNPLPNVTASVAKSQICRFEVSTITGNGATSYSWSTGAVTPTISFNLNITTNYTLTGTDLNNCSKTVTVTQFVATCIGVEDLAGNSGIGLNVYPNPNNGNFTISADVNISLSIVNTLGQVVGNFNLTNDKKKEVLLENLPSGVYFIIGQANGLNVNKKIVVEK